MLIISSGVQMCRASSLLLDVDDDEEQYVLDMSLDSYGARQRAITLNVPESDCAEFMQHLYDSERMADRPTAASYTLAIS